MAKQTVDPGFIGVPQFPRSTFDPVQFTRNLMAERRAKQTFESDRMRKKQQKNIDFIREQVGDVDIQAWEDEKGYDELSERKQAIFSKAMDAANRGYNLYTPETTEETKMMRELRQDLADLSGDVDIWNISKGKYAELEKERMRQEKLADPEEQTMDFEKYAQWQKDVLESPGTIQDRSRKLDDWDFFKEKPYTAEQFYKYLGEEVDHLLPGLDVKTIPGALDPNTGQITDTIWEGVDPERVQKALPVMYKRMGEKQKDFLNQEYNTAIASGEFDGSVYDFLGESAIPQYAEKVTKKRSSASGQKEKERRAEQLVAAARPPMNQQGVYDLSEYSTIERYGSTDEEGEVSTQSFKSAATLPMVSIFQNKGYTLPITTGTVDKLTGEEPGSEWAGGTIPIKVSFIPEAVKDFSVEAINPQGKKETVTIKAGDRIPDHVLKKLETETTMGEDYKYRFNPYVESHMYKSMMVDPLDGSFRPKVGSEKKTTIRPYDAFRNYLKNFAAGLEKDFTPFDQDVRAISEQLNKDLAKESAQYNSTGI